MLFDKIPDVLCKQMVQGADLAGQDGVGLHVGAEVAVIDAVQGVQLNGITLEVAGQEGVFTPK